MQLLKERIAKSSQLRKSVDKILNSFEQRLSRLEETILPVYNETENLQKCQHSILQNVFNFTQFKLFFSIVVS